MDKATFIEIIRPATEGGTLLVQKHDPSYKEPRYYNFKSVLTLEASASLESFTLSGDYDLNHYHDRKYPLGAGYFELIPTTTTFFSHAGLGIISGSLDNTTNLDRLVFVSGSDQGWHVYAEDSAVIAKHIEEGRLSLVKV